MGSHYRSWWMGIEMYVLHWVGWMEMESLLPVREGGQQWGG